MKKRFILLDYYKIIFIFLIAIGHFQQFFDISNTHNEIMLSRSYVYVEFFFLTSGFLLGRKIIESDFKFEFLDTVKKRLKQIYLDYFVSVFICALSIVLLKSKPICEVLFSVFGEVTFINSLGIDLGRTNAPAWFLSALMASTFFLLLIVKGLIQIGEKKIGIMLLMISIMSYSYIHFLTGAGIGYTLSERINCMIPIGTIRALGGVTLGVSISIIYNDIVRTKTINGVKNLMLIITGFGILCLLISSDNLVEIYRFESETLIIFAFVLILLGSLFYVRKPYKFEKVFIKYSMSIFLNHFMIAIILGYYLDNNESTYYKWIIPFVLFSIIASILISELVSKLRQALINRGKRKVNGTIST